MSELPRDHDSADELQARLARGEVNAARRLLPLVYDELHRLATAAMAGARPDHTLQPTALVHEAFLRLSRSGDLDPQRRRHFLGVAAKAMRSVLVDHARRRHADKRGGRSPTVSLQAGDASLEARPGDVLAVSEALERLEAFDPELVQLTELRCFAGLTLDEMAAVLGKSRSTVQRGWRVARAFLQRELGGNDGRAR